MKNYFLALTLISLCDLDAAYRKHKQHNEYQEPKEFCYQDKQRCEDKNDGCQCYCGFKPGPRDKTPDDTLIYVENDPFGNYCYCKQRDIDEVVRKADSKNK